MSSKPCEKPVSSFRDLGRVGDFDILVCDSKVKDPAGREAHLYVPNETTDVAWSEFFAYPKYYLGGSEGLNAQVFSEERDAPYKVLKPAYDKVADGRVVILETRAECLANLWFVATFLAGAVVYSRYWLGEDWPDDRDEASGQVIELTDDNDQVTRSFGVGGMYVYRDRHPFPVSAERGKLGGLWATAGTAESESFVTWHRKFSMLWKLISPPDAFPRRYDDRVCIRPELWRKSFVDEAFDPSSGFRVLATVGAGRPVCFAQRLGKGAIIVAPVTLTDAVLKVVRNMTLEHAHGAVARPGSSFWACLTGESASAGEHPTSTAESLNVAPQITPKRGVEFRVEALGIDIRSVNLLHVRLTKKGKFYAIPLDQLGVIRRKGRRDRITGRFSPGFRLLLRVFYAAASDDEGVPWVKSDGLGKTQSLRTACNALKRCICRWFLDKEGLILKNMKSVIRSDPTKGLRAGFDVCLGAFSILSEKDFNDGFDDAEEDRRLK